MEVYRNGTPRMKEEAVSLLCRGDAAGDGQASYRLAMVYLKSADKDKRDLARKLLERAMSRGVREAAGALQTLNAENPQTSASPTSQPAKSREPHL